MKYGPQTPEIEELIEKVKNLAPEQAEELSAAPDAAWDALLSAVRNAAWDALLGADRNAVWDAVWDAARSAAWDALLDAVWDALLGAVWDTALDAAWDAVRDAILALLVKDRISEEDFNILYGPWANVMEEAE